MKCSLETLDAMALDERRNGSSWVGETLRDSPGYVKSTAGDSYFETSGSGFVPLTTQTLEICTEDSCNVCKNDQKSKDSRSYFNTGEC